MKILVRGGGDLASGVILRLSRVGYKVLVTEIEKPTAIRRTVSFANAVFEKQITIENMVGMLANNIFEVQSFLEKGIVPVVIDPDNKILTSFEPDIVVDARMLKLEPEYDLTYAKKIIGLGPGFTAGENCHAVIETNRGHFLGHVIWSGEAEQNTNTPGKVNQYQDERVLRAPSDGFVVSNARIGDLFKIGEMIAYVNNQPIKAPFNGCLRGLIHPSVPVIEGMKIGDIDPRLDQRLTEYVSEKSLAIAGGVLEAIMVMTLNNGT